MARSAYFHFTWACLELGAFVLSLLSYLLRSFAASAVHSRFFFSPSHRLTPYGNLCRNGTLPLSIGVLRRTGAKACREATYVALGRDGQIIGISFLHVCFILLFI
jgi:hypothetical protein